MITKRKSDAKNNLSILTALIEDDYMYAVDIDVHMLVRINLNSGEVTIVADLSPNISCCFWVQQIVRIGKRLFIIQRNTHELIAVSDDGTVERYFEEEKRMDDACFYNMGALALGDKLYILPGTLGGVLRVFDTKDNRLIEETVLNSILNIDKSLSQNVIIKYNINGEKVWFCIEDTKFLVNLNVSTKKADVFEAKTMYNFKRIISGADGILILCGENNGLIKFRPEYEDFEECNGIFENRNVNNFVIQANNQIITCSSKTLKLRVYDEGRKQNMEIPLPADIMYINEMRYSDVLFGEVIKKGDKLYCLPFSANRLLIVNMKDFIMKTLSIKLPYYLRAYRNGRKSGLMIENEYFDLEDFYKCLNESKFY